MVFDAMNGINLVIKAVLINAVWTKYLYQPLLNIPFRTLLDPCPYFHGMLPIEVGNRITGYPECPKLTSQSLYLGWENTT
jgi:hypothetical protein